MRPGSAAVREAIASARSQPVASALTIVLVAGMVVAVMLTSGRTVGAQRDVLSSIDSVGTRAIVIRADDGAGVTSDVLERIERIDGIAWAGAFSSSVDATNSLIAGGPAVPVRYAYGDQLDQIGLPAGVTQGNDAYASAEALDRLGLPDVVGGVTLSNGASFNLAGELSSPSFLHQFEPLVLVPRPTAAGNEPVNLIVVIARSPELVAPVANGVLPLLDATDPTAVTVETSETLAQLRSLIESQLGSFSNGLVLALLALTAFLLATILYGLVTLRRKDFGRRRALGATRSFIVTILLTQTVLLALLGVVTGTALAALVLRISGDPLPGAGYLLALAIITLATAVISALAPAAAASRREPIRELRVP